MFAHYPNRAGCVVFLILASIVGIVPGNSRVVASTGQLVLTVVDKDTGKPIPCRMHLIGPKSKPFRPPKVPYWKDHFAFAGKITLKLPVGEYGFVLERGLEYADCKGHFTINHFADDAKQVELRRFIDMAADGWWSGDLDVRRPVRDIDLLMDADDLHVAEVRTWQNGKWLPGTPPPEKPLVSLAGNRYCQTMAGAITWPGNELLLFNRTEPLTISADVFCPPLKTLAEARVGGPLWVDATKPYWWDLPILVAAGQIDSIELAHSNIGRNDVVDNEADGRPRDRRRYPEPFGNAQWSQFVYFQLLECGLRIPPSAGSGSGESPNPIGQNRVYVHVDGPFDYEKWWESFRQGQVFLTNGPLLKPEVNGEPPGHVFPLAAEGAMELEIGLTLSTRDPISYLEIIKDGQIECSIPFDVYAKTGQLPKLHFDRSGWFLIRAVTDMPKTYRFAMTGPYYVEQGEQPRISKQACRFFLDWIAERQKQFEASDVEKRDASLDCCRKAGDFWQDLLSKANAE